MVSVAATDTGMAAKRSYLRELGLPIMFGAVVLLVSATLLLGANISALRGNQKWVEHSQQVLNQLSKLEAAVLSDEMTLRGYALTGDKRFLEFQKGEQARCRTSLAELKRLAGVEGHRADDFRVLDRDVRHHMDLFGSLAVQGPERAAVVGRAIVDPAVRETMRLTRERLEQLREAELRDLGARQRQITDQLGRAFLLAIGIIVTAFVLGGVGMWATQLTPIRR